MGDVTPEAFFQQAGGVKLAVLFCRTQRSSLWAGCHEPRQKHPAPRDRRHYKASVRATRLVGDYQYAGFTYPTCLGSNDHSSYTQTWTATVGGTQYNLSTVVSISLGEFSGTPEDNVNITTP